MINIVGIPMGDHNIASSRLRFYSLMNNLPDNLFSFEIFSEKTNFTNCDVIYIQKCADPSYLDLLKTTKIFGYKITVIFDIDDDLTELKQMFAESNFVCEDFIKLSDAIFVDTIERKKELKKITNKDIYVIPNSVDYWDEIKKNSTFKIQKKVKTIGTFGNPANCLSASLIWQKLNQSIKKFMITVPNLRTNETIVPWTLDSFISNLSRMDVCILSHPNNDISKLKSNNRLLVCMAAGVPSISSNTPSFSDTLEDAGLSKLIYSSQSEFDSIFNKIQNQDYRKEIQKKGVDYVFKHYTPKKSAMIFSEFVQQSIKINLVSKSRTHVINSLIKKFNYTSYLEIGVCQRFNFNLIDVKYKDGVDPAGNCNYKLTSDAFFLKLKKHHSSKRYDLIFIDGLHTEQQVIKDINNSLDFISKNGTIVIHDCNPLSKFHQLESRVNKKLGIPIDDKPWTGTTWKGFMHFRLNNPNISMFTIDTDCGIGIIRPGTQTLYQQSKKKSILDYDVFEKDKVKALNLISPYQFFEWLENIK